MSKFPDCITRLIKAGIGLDDAEALRRISMTLQRWSELECGNSNTYGSWAIEREEEWAIEKVGATSAERWWDGALWAKRATRRTYDDYEKRTMVAADGCPPDSVFRETGSKPFMVNHHYMHGAGKDTVTRTLIADRERGALRRLAVIMAKYPGYQAYHQTDPRGAALYILRSGDVPEGESLSRVYTNGIAVMR